MPICPHCGHEADAPAAECPLCGTPLAGDAGETATSGRAAGGPAGPGGGTVTAARTIPWEDTSEEFVPGFVRTWKESLFEPDAFFRRVRDEGSLLRPVLYYLLVTVMGAFFTLVWQSVWVSMLNVGAYAGVGAARAAGPVLSFFASPFLALFFFLIGTVVLHLGALMLAPDRQGMGATARVVCYAAGPTLLAVVPILGSLVGGVWSLVLQVVGLREAHRSSTGRALLMVFWLPLLFIVFGMALALVVGLLASGGDGGALAAGILREVAAAARWIGA